MKAVAVLLVVLSFLTVSHGWTCKAGPQQFPAQQIDAGEGQVVLTDRDSKAYYLSESTWFELGSVALKHVSVGPAGIWGVDSSDKVYKYVAGDFILVNGQTLQQVDAGGDGQVVGVTSGSYIYCLKSSIALNYSQVGSVSWNELAGRLMYFSCSPLGCWGVNAVEQIFYTRVTPNTCDISGWIHIPGAALMAEVGTDGNVFVVNRQGHVYQRTGISPSVPQGTDWLYIPMCLPIKHVSYDLGQLWLVTKGGIIMQCSN
ncbi:fish-egg lectin-like [Parambassis ranga]|uniref:Fish-egg lectin-like n=1 Tax=Parambassis ranga TaxID=210632 RepID=A0A6P7HSW5_9TELE|nr:fish-egg lectin-like [Parambassis ranga]XP_028255165.1 fish-egg lectin-like [Parambassis ranga]